MFKSFLLVLAVICSSLPALSQEERKPKALFRQLTQIEGTVNDLTFSSDGLKLAFTNKESIHSVGLKDGIAERITSDQFSESHPQWSPDGFQLTYQKDSSGITSIWVFDSRQKRHRRISPIKENTFNPSWAPNGKAIAFSTDSYGSVDVMINEFDKEKERRLTAAKGNEFIFGFHPNGRFVGYYERDTPEEDIYAISLTGKEEFPITRTLAKEFSPRWSYDGSRVIYFVKMSEEHIIYTADFPYGELNKIGPFDYKDILPIISATGERVIYPQITEGTTDLILYDIKRKERTPLELKAIPNLGQPVWSLGGRILALSSYDSSSDESVIWLVNIGQFLRER